MVHKDETQAGGREVQAVRKRQWFWQVVIAGVFTIIAAVVAALIAKPIPAKPPVVIATIDSSAPDYVVIKNTTQVPVPIGLWKLEEDDKSFQLPEATKLEVGGSLRVWFLKTGEAPPPESDASDLSSDAFRIKTGEKISLYDGGGQLINEKLAP